MSQDAALLITFLLPGLWVADPLIRVWRKWSLPPDLLCSVVVPTRFWELGSIASLLPEAPRLRVWAVASPWPQFRSCCCSSGCVTSDKSPSLCDAVIPAATWGTGADITGSCDNPMRCCKLLSMALAYLEPSSASLSNRSIETPPNLVSILLSFVVTFIYACYSLLPFISLIVWMVGFIFYPLVWLLLKSKYNMPPIFSVQLDGFSQNEHSYTDSTGPQKQASGKAPASSCHPLPTRAPLS